MIQREVITDELLIEATELFKEHHIETKSFDDDISIDRNLYMKMSHIMMYACYTLRVEEGEELVGYVGYFIQPHTHCLKNMAFQDVLFIRKGHRSLKNILGLCKFSEEDLKRSYGIDTVIRQTSSVKDLSLLFRRCGYKYAGSIYSKEL